MPEKDHHNSWISRAKSFGWTAARKVMAPKALRPTAVLAMAQKLNDGIYQGQGPIMRQNMLRSYGSLNLSRIEAVLESIRTLDYLLDNSLRDGESEPLTWNFTWTPQQQEFRAQVQSFSGYHDRRMLEF
jgi:hypothetical protein